MWILTTGETRSLTRAATLGIVQDVSCLIDDIVSQIQCNLDIVLQQNSIDPASIINLESAFNESYTKPFDCLLTFYQQLQFFQKFIWFNSKFSTCMYNTYMYRNQLE